MSGEHKSNKNVRTSSGFREAFVQVEDDLLDNILNVCAFRTADVHSPVVRVPFQSLLLSQVCFMTQVNGELH